MLNLSASKKYRIYIKAISLMIAFVFLFENIGYSFIESTPPLSHKTNLRKPLSSQKDSKEYFALMLAKAISESIKKSLEEFQGQTISIAHTPAKIIIEELNGKALLDNIKAQNITWDVDKDGNIWLAYENGKVKKYLMIDTKGEIVPKDKVDSAHKFRGSHHRVQENKEASEGKFRIVAEYNTWSVHSSDLPIPQIGLLQRAFDYYLQRHPAAKSEINLEALSFEITGGERLGNTVHDRDNNPVTIQIHRYALQKDLEAGTSIPWFILNALEDEFAHFEIEKRLGIEDVVIEEVLVILSRLFDEIVDSMQYPERLSVYEADWLTTTFSGEMGNSLSGILSETKTLLLGGGTPNILKLMNTLDKGIHELFGFVKQSYKGKGYEEYETAFKAYNGKGQEKAERIAKDIFIQMFLEQRSRLSGKARAAAQTVEIRGEVSKPVEVALDTSRITSINELSRVKLQDLISTGHNEFLARQLVDKQIVYAQRQAIILKRGLGHIEYLRAFIDAMAELERVSDFFGIDYEILLKLLEVSLSDRNLFLYYQTFLEIVESMPEARPGREGLVQRYGKFPKISDITEANFQDFLRANIDSIKSKRPELKKRSNALLQKKSGDELIEEAFRYYEFFLYSEEFSLDFYEELQRLTDTAGLSLNDVINGRRERLSSSEEFIVSEIETKGRVTYAEYMQMALYDEKYGFYTREREEGDEIPGSRKEGKGEFETLPEEFSDFGRGIAIDLFNRWVSLGKPEEFQIIEMGAGRGAMARDILQEVEDNRGKSEAWERFSKSLRYKIVEISAPLILKQKNRVGDLAKYIEWIEGSAVNLRDIFKENSVTGAFISNELPDAFGVHKVKIVGAALKEVFVKVENGVLVEAIEDLSDSELKRFIDENNSKLSEGESRVINLDSIKWLSAMNNILKQGFIITLDYGNSFGLDQVTRNIKPQFRKYGRERSNQEMAYLGVLGTGGALDELAVSVKLLEEEVGKEDALRIIADRMKDERIGEYSSKGGFRELATSLFKTNPFEDMEAILTDYAANPLPQSGNVDITTDADFPAMESHARRLGLKKVFFDTQCSYFAHLCYPDLESRKALPDDFFDEISYRYKAQVFQKTEPLSKEKQALLPEFIDLLNRGKIETIEDIELFIRFLEDANPCGLGDVAQAIRKYAKDTGRRLAGISSDSFIRLKDFGGHKAGSFVFDPQNEFLNQACIKSGISLSSFLGELINLTPKAILPEAYQGYAKTIPAIKGDMPFGELYNAILHRFIKLRTLETLIAADFIRELDKKGYQIFSESLRIVDVQRIVEEGIDNLEKKIAMQEPLRSQYQINALRITSSIAQGRKDMPFLIELQDIFSYESGIYQFSQQAILNLLREAWSQTTGEDAIKFILKITSRLPPSSYSLVAQIFSSREMDMQKFFELKEILVGAVISVLGEYLDKDRAIEQTIVKTDLGQRVLPMLIGDALRIQREPENTRSLVMVFGKYLAYVEHARRVKPEQLANYDIIPLIRILDPERDIDLLKILVQHLEKNPYGSSRLELPLVEALYEAGFKEKALGIVKGWGTDNYYRWSPEAVKYLSEKEEWEVLLPYIEAHKNRFLQNRGDFNLEFKPMCFSIKDRAHDMFKEEWQHIKNTARVLMLADKNVGYMRETGGWWDKNKANINLSEQPFDPFSPACKVYFRGDEDIKFLKSFVNFINSGLSNNEFYESALDIVYSLDDSAMKLCFIEKAAEFMPKEWDESQIRDFYRNWNKTLHSVGQQIEAHRFMEPYGEFYNAWPKPFFDENDDRWAGDPRKDLPENYRQTKFFHAGIKTMLESLSAIIDNKSSRELTSLGEELLNSIGYRRTPFFNLQTTLAKERHVWKENPLFYSGNSYASLYSLWNSKHGRVSTGAFRRILRECRKPVYKEYSNMYFSPGDSSFSRVIAYIENVERFSNEMKYLYTLALKNGFNEEAEVIYTTVRETLSDLSKEAKENYQMKGGEKIVNRLMAEWAIQEDLGKIIYNYGVDMALSETLGNRFEVDTRNFFSPAIIADTARELSQRQDLHSLSVRVFEISIKKMAAIRGEKDNFSRDVVNAIKDSSLTDNEKDGVLLKLMQEMWPKEKHLLTSYFNMRGDLIETALFFKELLSEDKYPKAREYLLTRIADSAGDLAPKKYGERLKGETSFSQFDSELKALAYITGCFRERREVANPANFKGLMSLYPASEDAFRELEELFPDLVKTERAKTKTTSLPSIADIENGNFDPDKLKDILPSLLQPSQPENVWKEAFLALEAWLRYDVLTILSQKEAEEEKKEWGKRKGAYIDRPDLEKNASFQIAWRIISQYVGIESSDAFQQMVFSSMLNTKTEKEAFGKAFMGYELLKQKDAALIWKNQAFEMLTKSGYFPHYVSFIYKERIKQASNQEQEEFFNDVSMWDHTTPQKERPRELWAHLFEVDKGKRALLRKRIRDMLEQKDKWRPDLRLEQDWWVMLQCLEDQLRNGFEQYAAALIYQKHLRTLSLKERVLFHSYQAYELDKVMVAYFLDEWKRLEDVTADEVCRVYEEKYPQGEVSWGIKEALEILRRDFDKNKKLYLRYKQAISQNRLPEFDSAEYQQADDKLAIFELLKIRDKVEPDAALDLKTILRVSFPGLTPAQIDSLYNLAVNPFQIQEDMRREGGKHVGKSKDWWTQTGYRYYGEKIWQEELLKVVSNNLSDEERKSLVCLMYPFSKTFYHNCFYSLYESFPFHLPEKSYSFEKKADVTIAQFVLPQFAMLSEEELFQVEKSLPGYARQHTARSHYLETIERRIPVYARTHLARSHTMELSFIEIPENLKEYAAFALFLFKSYFSTLDIGPREQLIAELKGLGKKEALHKLLELRDLIKPGQMLADRPEIPEDYREILSEFRNKVTPSDIEEARNTIEAELGWRNGDFKIIRLLNCGSMGEVYLVTHKDYGIPLAVKVLPGSKERKIKKVMEEMKTIREILSWYVDISVESAIAAKVIDRLLSLMEQELDYRNDLKNWQELFGFNHSEPNIKSLKIDGTIPIPGTDFWAPMYFKAAKGALVMSYVEGVELTDEPDSKEKIKIAYRLWAYLQGRIMDSDDGLYPLDLHLGNILKTTKSGKVVILDTGQVGRIGVPGERKFLSDFIVVLFMRDPEQIVDILENIGERVEGQEFNREALISEVRRLAESPEKSDMQLIERLFIKTRYYGLTIKDSFVDLLKAMMSFRGTAIALDPQFQFALAPQTHGAIRRNVGSREILGVIGKEGSEIDRRLLQPEFTILREKFKDEELDANKKLYKLARNLSMEKQVMLERIKKARSDLLKGKKPLKQFPGIVRNRNTYGLGIGEENLLGYSQELISALPLNLKVEYLFHEALCYYFSSEFGDEKGHQISRQIQKILFPENYPEDIIDKGAGSPELTGNLTIELRKFIDTNVPSRRNVDI